MSLSLFATQVTAGSGPLSGSNNPLLNGNGLGGLGGTVNSFDFLTALLGNIGEEGDIKATATNQNQDEILTENGLNKEAVDLTLLQLALLGQDADHSLEEKLAELKIENLAKTENNRAEQITKLISHLTSGLPQEATGESAIEDLVARLTKRLETIESTLDVFRDGSFEDQDAPFKLLIATGLNPAQLTKITARIEEVETKLGRELTVEDLIAGVGNIIPAPGEKDHEFSVTDAIGVMIEKNEQHEEELEQVAKNKNNNDNDATPLNGPAQSFAVQDLLNMIKPNNIAPVVSTPQAVVNNTVNDTTILPEDGITPVPQALSNAEFKALFGGNSDSGQNAVLKNTTASLVTNNITPNAALPKVGFLGDLMIPSNWMNTQSSQAILSDILGYDIETGTPFNHTMQAAHSVTTPTQQAGQTHPGTQMVAAQITKNVVNGDSRNITLQLNPAELGRVEVRMEFGADNAVKAHLIVEKPETYLMLQRDVAALERALSDLGMETGSDSMNFEMASEDYNFGEDSKGRHGNSGTDHAMNNTDEDIEMIFTNVDWNIDPRTGHVHYNILA
jgi:flagellar hook-length control protein FliK